MSIFDIISTINTCDELIKQFFFFHFLSSKCFFKKIFLFHYDLCCIKQDWQVSNEFTIICMQKRWYLFWQRYPNPVRTTPDIAQTTNLVTTITSVTVSTRIRKVFPKYSTGQTYINKRFKSYIHSSLSPYVPSLIYSSLRSIKTGSDRDKVAVTC